MFSRVFYAHFGHNGKKNYTPLDSLGSPLSIGLCPNPYSLCNFSLQEPLKGHRVPFLQKNGSEKIEIIKLQTPNFIFIIMYCPFSIPEQIIPLPPSGVALGGSPPQNKKIMNSTVIKLQTPNFLFIVVY